MRRLYQKFVHALRSGGLPLLAKELTEQAARRQTYVLRAVYASILFLVVYLFFYNTFSAASTSPLAVLGQGQYVLMTLVVSQFIGIYLFMPAITCGVITQEKERDSLQLLFLTQLGPWTIVFEKLLSRIVPMLGFLLLSLPALAIAYVLGGVTPQMLWSGIGMLVVAMIQTGSIAIMFSAFFRSTVAAFIMSYLLMFVLFFGPYFLLIILFLVGTVLAHFFDFSPDQSLGRFFGPSSAGIIYFCLFPCFGLPLYFVQSQLPGFFGSLAIGAHAAINLGLSAGFLALARKFLVSRAFLPARNSVSRAAHSRERKRATPLSGDSDSEVRELTHSDDDSLPNDRPILWREAESQMFGNWSDLKRLFLMVELPTLAFCGLLVIAETFANRYEIQGLIEMLTIPVHGLVWLIAVLVVSVKSAGLIATERTHQTLDVLCATPLTGRQILAEKMHGVWRLILVLTVPFFTVFVFKAWFLSVREIPRNMGTPYEKFSPTTYLICQALSMGILLPLVAWLSLFIGLRLRTQARAIIGAMGAIVAWSVAPLIFIVVPLAIVFDGNGRDPFDKILLELSSLLSPAAIVFLNEVNLLKDWDMPTWVPIFLNFSFYGLCLFGFRRLCLKNVDRWLGRVDSFDQVPPLNAVPEPEPSEPPASLNENKAE